MLIITIFTGLFAKLGHTRLSICDNHLITIDHRIPIGCNMFLRASRAFSCDVTAIKKAIKIFSLACQWFIKMLELLLVNEQSSVLYIMVKYLQICLTSAMQKQDIIE